MVLKKDVDSRPLSNDIKISKSAKCELRFSPLSRQYNALVRNSIGCVVRCYHTHTYIASNERSNSFLIRYFHHTVTFSFILLLSSKAMRCDVIPSAMLCHSMHDDASCPYSANVAAPICMRVYMHVCVYYACMFVCMYVFVCMYACMYVCICVYVCMYVCMYVYLCVCFQTVQI